MSDASRKAWTLLAILLLVIRGSGAFFLVCDLVTLPSGAVLNALGAVALGAPIGLQYLPKTIHWSFLMSVFTFVPATAVFGASSTDWHRVFASLKPTGNIEYMILIPAYGAIIGGWFGAWPMPLDWEMPWQIFNRFTMAQKLDARGGKGGSAWDDGGDHDNIATIYVRGGYEGIQFIQFDYVKNGKETKGPIHGSSGKGFTHPFKIDYLHNEYLEVVEGYFDEATGVVQGVRFKTNLNPNPEVIGDDSGTKFSLGVPQKKIIGFQGFAGTNLNSLGPYVTKFPPIKLPYQGAGGGAPFDDGGDYDGVRKVRITYDGDVIRSVTIDYDKGGNVVTRVHGRPVGTTKEFVVANYPNDYITSVEGTYANIGGGWGRVIVTSLTFKTSKGVTSPPIGHNRGTRFVLQSQGRAVVGFHGRIGGALDAIGVYCGAPPLPPPPPSEKLTSKGGEGGAPWDDGAFDGVKEIHVGQGLNGIVAVKFVYEKDSQEVVGDDRGKKTGLGYETFPLQYPSEYLIEVQGCFDKILGSEGGVITMLKFKTNLRVSDPYGLESSSSFVIGKEGYKIVGFHGSSSHELHQLGVHVVPITN